MREQVLDYKHLAQIAVQNNQALEVVCKQVLVEAVPLHFPQHLYALGCTQACRLH